MEISEALKIEDEIIYGRDRFWLVRCRQTSTELIVDLEIDLKNRVVNKRISFVQAVFYSSTELDTYEKSSWSESWLTSSSNFERIVHSQLLERRVKIRSDYQQQDFHHYRISTYDDIFDIVAKGYTIADY